MGEAKHGQSLECMGFPPLPTPACEGDSVALDEQMRFGGFQHMAVGVDDDEQSPEPSFEGSSALGKPQYSEGRADMEDMAHSVAAQSASCREHDWAMDPSQHCPCVFEMGGAHKAAKAHVDHLQQCCGSMAE